MGESRLQQLSKLGQSVWIDYLSRRLIHEGVEQSPLVRGQKRPRLIAVDPDDPDGATPGMHRKKETLGARQRVRTTSSRPVVLPCPTRCREIGRIEQPLGGRVEDSSDPFDAEAILQRVGSFERLAQRHFLGAHDPNLAFDTQGTIDEAQRLHDVVDRPNCFVKIPATEAGLPAIEEMIARGRNINVTLIFSLQRYIEVVEAYLRGLERLVEGGGDPSKVASVASFFVSRVDTEADRRLDEAGAPADLKGKLAVANAKLAYQRYKELHSGERWQKLSSHGATKQRCLWASTSTKNPDYRDVLYVEELIGPETVDTMPEETIEAFEDHGEVALMLERDVDGAKRVFERVKEAGVDYDDVVAVLEQEGVQKFSDSFTELLDGIRAKRGELVSA